MARPRYPRPVNWSMVLDIVGTVALCFLLPWLVVVGFAL